MCTYATLRCAVQGSGKSSAGWISLTDATVYLDHPVHANAMHTLNIDLTAPARGPAARVAVELEPQSAYRLLSVVAEALLSAPGDISELTDEQRSRLAAFLEVAATPA